MTKESDQEILSKVYVNLQEVQQLLQMPYKPAKALFEKIRQEEKDRLGEYYVWSQKVRLKTVLRTQGLSMTEMQQLIDQRPGQAKEKSA